MSGRLNMLRVIFGKGPQTFDEDWIEQFAPQFLNFVNSNCNVGGYPND